MASRMPIPRASVTRFPSGLPVRRLRFVFLAAPEAAAVPLQLSCIRGLRATARDGAAHRDRVDMPAGPRHRATEPAPGTGEPEREAQGARVAGCRSDAVLWGAAVRRPRVRGACRACPCRRHFRARPSGEGRASALDRLVCAGHWNRVCGRWSGTPSGGSCGR